MYLLSETRGVRGIRKRRPISIRLGTKDESTEGLDVVVEGPNCSSPRDTPYGLPFSGH